MPMTPEQNALWSKIAAFEIDDAASDFRFSDRLARENFWTNDYAAAVIDEYRRFVFLAFAAGHPVTPSVDVDEVWHLHLIYTRSYWDDLCRDTLGGPLHHGPTRGGSAEAGKFDDWYRRTLESYRRLFDRTPPADIWPRPEIRFGAAARTVHVRPATHWVVPKPRQAISKLLRHSHFGRPGRAAAIFAIATVVTLVVSGCRGAVDGNANGAAFSNPITTFDARRFLIFYPIAWVAIFALTAWLQRLLLNEPVQDETIREFEHESPETIALIQERLGHRHRLTEMLMARLIAADRIRFDETLNRYVPGEVDSKPANPFDAEMQKAVAWGKAAAKPPTIAQYASRLAESTPVSSLTRRLDEKRLFSSTTPIMFAQAIGLTALGGFLAIGAARAQVGVARHRPIGFLILEMIVGGLVGLLWVAGPLLRSRYAPAAKILQSLRRKPSIGKPVVGETVAATDDDYWRSFAVVGLAVLPTSGMYAIYRNHIQPPVTDSGGVDGSSYGGADGGGAGGGGCGGCGGGGCGGG